MWETGFFMQWGHSRHICPWAYQHHLNKKREESKENKREESKDKVEIGILQCYN